MLSEAYMMRLAPSLGRERAHDLVYEAAASCRATGRSLLETIRSLGPPDAADVLNELRDGLEPADYLGDAVLTCDAAVAAWRGADEQERRLHGRDG